MRKDTKGEHLRGNSKRAVKRGMSCLRSFTSRSLSVSVPQQASQANHRPVEDLSMEFHTAFQQIEENNTRLTFDIKKIDSLLTLNIVKEAFVLLVGKSMPKS
jgi:hypothetical protein